MHNLGRHRRQQDSKTAKQHLGILLLVASELRLVLDETSLELAGEDAEVLLGPQRLEQRREIFHELTLHGISSQHYHPTACVMRDEGWERG